MGTIHFHMPDGELVVKNDPPSLATAAEHIWFSFERERLQDLTVRSGVIYCGCYPGEKVPSQPVVIMEQEGLIYTGVGAEHPETVSHHVHSCQSLTRLFMEEYPLLFTRHHLPPIDSLTYHYEILLAFDRINRLLAYHDEEEPFSVDTPDDGSQSRTTKNRRELKQFIVNTANLPPIIRERLIKDFVIFQNCTAQDLYDGQTQYDTELVQLARVIDKADAVLSALINEKRGHPGTFRNKQQNRTITDSDKFYIDFCDNDHIADTWAAHFMHLYHEYYGFDVVLDVIHAAVLDVRGQWYPWWPKACREFNLDDTILQG